MRVAIGHSEDVDSEIAVEEVLEACVASLNGYIPQAGLVYVAIDHEFQVVLDRIMERFPDLELVGCTTDGELSSSMGFAEDSLVLMLFQSDKVGMKAGIGEGVREEPVRASKDAFAMASDGLEDPIRLCITNPAGLGTDMAAILGALSGVLGIDVPICGGLAGDQTRFDTTYQFYKNIVRTNAIPVLLFSGPLLVSTGVQSGYEPLGRKHRVTRAESNIVYSIEDEPAKDFWRRYFGTLEFEAYLHAMAIFPDESVDREDDSAEEPNAECGDFYLSTPARFREDGSMVVLNPIPEGAFMRLADATRDKLVAGTASSIQAAYAGYPGTRPDAALIYSCAGRRVILGMRVKEEHELLRKHLGEDVPIGGFYTYGEFCPLPNSPAPRSHGTTFVTVLLGES